MTPRLASKLTIHGEGLGGALRRQATVPSILGVERARANPSGPVAVEERAPPSVFRRAALGRRLLGLADVIAVTVTVGIVLNVGEHRALLLVLAMPLVIIPFKVAGLYDRDELLLMKSTLDEVPALMQLTALFGLGVAIAKWLVEQGTLGGDQIAGPID